VGKSWSDPTLGDDGLCAGHTLHDLLLWFTDETEVEAKQEKNEMNDGALAVDLRCFNGNGADVWYHNRK
jgi:hypothetical protein